MKDTDTTSKANDFAAMFEKSLTGISSFQVGQAVETTVVSISGDTVFLQLGGKSEGVLAREELTDKDGKLTVEVGDPIKSYFLDARSGEMRFTTKIGREKAGSAMIEQAYRNGIPVEGEVVKEIKGGYEVRIGEARAFCPYSQMGMKRVEDGAEYVGKRLTFKIQEYKEGGRNLLVSNRAILEAARQEELEGLKSRLAEGMVVKGTIASIRDFGAFVDLGGVQALLPASEISRSRVDDVGAVLSVGQEIEAEILKLDWKNERFTLSMKSLSADPWEGAAERYPVDSRHKGKVARLADFGAFVSLEPGIDGLVHVSEFKAAGGRGGEKMPAKGQELAVQVLGVDAANRRISLKPVSEEDEATRGFIETSDQGETYNPFAALLKKK